MSSGKEHFSLEVVGCKLLSQALLPSDKEKIVKVYVTVIQSGAAQLSYPTVGKRLFEIDSTFGYTWVFWNEKIRHIPKECKLIIELRLLDHNTEKEIKFASCAISGSLVSEEVTYFDLTEIENRQFDGMVAAVGLRVVSAQQQQLFRSASDNDNREKQGRLRAVIWRGRKISSSYPVYLTIRLTVAGAEKHKTAVASMPKDPIFDHIADMDICSMQGDVVIALWEVHNVRSHKQLGQIIFPLSWLANLSTQSKTGTTACLSGWFHFLPLNKITAYNNGGQYRPYIPGTPQSTGFGIDEHEKDKRIGYLRVHLELELKKPIFRNVFFQPSLYSHGTPEYVNMDDDSITAIVASMIVAKNNLMQLYQRLRHPIWLETFIDIVRWREHPLFTFCAIYFWTYLILAAPTWQYPVLICFFFILLGFATSRRRNFNSSRLFTPEMDVNSSEELSLREKYNKLKSAAYTVASLVESMRVTVERLGNIFTWADPLLTAATIVLLLVFCGSFSLVLFIFPPHHFIFCAGMMAFVPEDFMDYAIMLIKKYKKRVVFFLKQNLGVNKTSEVTERGSGALAAIEYQKNNCDVSVTETNILSPKSSLSQEGSIVRDDPESLPSSPKTNIFKHGPSGNFRRTSVVCGSIVSHSSIGGSINATISLHPSDLSPAGHLQSAFLLSQWWEKGVCGQEDTKSPKKSVESFGNSDDLKSGSDNLEVASTSTPGGKQWSSRWCEIWKAPPVLSIMKKSNDERIFVNLEGAFAYFMYVLRLCSNIFCFFVCLKKKSLMYALTMMIL